MEYLLTCIAGVLEPSTLATMAWNEVELGLHLLFLMEELVSSTGSRRQTKFAGAAPADPAVATDILDRAMHVMLASGVDQYTHGAVVQQHFEGEFCWSPHRQEDFLHSWKCWHTLVLLLLNSCPSLI